MQNLGKLIFLLLSGMAMMIQAYPVESQNFDDIVANIGQEPFGLRTGFTELDNMTRGLHPGELTILAGRSSMGKSAFMLDVALHLDCSVAIFSLEMGYITLCERLVANYTNTNYHYLKSGKIAPPDVSELKSKNITILDNSYLTPAKFHQQLVQLKAEQGIKCAMVDFLQLVKPDLSTGSRYQDIDAICQSLRATGKELGIAIVVLAQLNREIEKRENHEPKLSDLRESAGIEQSADVVLMLHRPDYYQIKEIDLESEDGGEAYIYISKQRNGPVGKIPLVWLSEFMSFREIKPETF